MAGLGLRDHLLVWKFRDSPSNFKTIAFSFKWHVIYARALNPHKFHYMQIKGWFNHLLAQSACLIHRVTQLIMNFKIEDASFRLQMDFEKLKLMTSKASRNENSFVNSQISGFFVRWSVYRCANWTKSIIFPNQSDFRIFLKGRNIVVSNESA